MAASARPQFVDPSISFPVINPSSQTRILHLSSSREHGITCRLSVIPIDEPPPYEALSYVWGSAEDLEVITVDGHAFRVTQNLYAALNSLVPPEEAVRMLWIDAICINQGTEQSDLAERSQQVRIMARIFSGATNVIAYLGEPYPGLSEAMEFFTVVSGGQQSQVDRLARSPDCSISQVCEALIYFFNKPWWNRIWTVQEHISGRKVVFQFGQLHIDSDIVRDAIDNAFTPEIEARVAFTKLEMTSLTNFFGASAKMKILSTSYNGTSLLNVLGNFRNRASGDPRDKIYSLMGLCPSSHHVVDLDYTMSPEQLFQNFTLAWIQKHQDLEVLGHIHDPERRVHRNMPSFAVDWSYRPSMRTIDASHNRSFLQNKMFDACKGTKAIWHRDSAGRVRANGFVFDSIEAIGAKDVLLFGSSWDNRFKTLQGIVSMARERAGDDRQETETLTTIRHTLCTDCKWEWERGVSTRLRGEDEERVLDEWWDIAFKPSPPALADRFAFSEGPIEHTVWCASRERSFIFTRSGSMGLALDWCKPGDAIAIMGGGTVPIVLRPVNQTGDQGGDGAPCFEVVGEAYVHGFMDGQAFDVSGRTEGNFDDIYIV